MAISDRSVDSIIIVFYLFTILFYYILFCVGKSQRSTNDTHGLNFEAQTKDVPISLVNQRTLETIQYIWSQVDCKLTITITTKLTLTITTDSRFQPTVE